MKLVTAVLARNEGAPDRYLRCVLKNALSFSDKVLLLDDNSQDNTREIALDLEVSVSKRPASVPAWGAERSARQELWEWGAKEAKDGWLLLMDADMVLHGDPRPLCLSWDCNAWAFSLWDLWDDEQHARVDQWWAGGPTMPRPWLFCPSRGGDQPLTFGPPDAIGRKDWTPRWNDRGVHVGHCPQNFNLVCGIAPPDIYWLHYAYLKKEHRVQKYAQYLAVKDQLSEFELAHAASILA
jgi:hypothetical protein